ncbi:hypothetical protein Clacol_009923 [Clathrus columnatus]|uniref:rRNA-processing protein EBP2 n=1 Tax=Clathrus columnatus TaxID=1419009 RepID=A0AAV5AMJ2_9AGAM|nr:hypothetical protein Clacol_009923 [Clathrus columnatus]
MSDGLPHRPHMKKSKEKKKPIQEQPSMNAEKNSKIQYSSELENSDDDNSGVDDKGMERLMVALGEDGLDDIAQSMLKALDEQGDDEEVSNESEAESLDGEEAEESDEDQNEGPDADSDSEDEDEDAEYVPKVKLRAEFGSEDDEDGDNGDDDDETDGENNVRPGRAVLTKESKKGTHHDENDEALIELDKVSDVDEDAIPRQKLVVNDKHALDRILDDIRLDKSLSWTETLSTTYPQTHEVDVSNDLDRELSFYKQALHCAEAARKLAAEHSLPFTRPSDFFAEMVKSDAHMERIRQRLLDETAQIKRGEDKRKEREGKKFGKQVQLEKIKERERSKKDMDEKIKSLKRKRKGGTLNDGPDDDFDVALEEAVEGHPRKKPRMPRNRRNEKYGFGGKGSVGWRSKQNTNESTDQFVSRKPGKNGKGGAKKPAPKRPGKARRMANRKK